ncbi:MAG: polysaccharide pyruvyl transferase family protein [Thomasclavelia sp.]|uniref:polysaccharide pyruvyl transferase family protein n=1 Tax=Thomasclavelia sp. TaxID=3025757 RepID=UPI0039A3C0AF
MENKFLILPGCDDRNRGDQALIWETIALAQAAGYKGKFLMLANHDGSRQSQKAGIGNVHMILEHPSTKFRKLDNEKYTWKLKLKWGIVAIWDIFTKEPLTHSWTRNLLKKLYKKTVQYSLKDFGDAGACFVKGGGFLHAYGGLSETYKIYYFLYHIRLALSLGKTVYILPNSFGPFKSPFVKRMMNKTLSKCKVVMAREKISQEQLKKECLVDSLLFTDIAFHLEPDKSFDANRKLIEQGIPIGEKNALRLQQDLIDLRDMQIQIYYIKIIKKVWFIQLNGYQIMIFFLFLLNMYMMRRVMRMI